MSEEQAQGAEASLDQSVSEEQSAAPVAEVPKAEPVSTKRKLKYQVDGEELEEEIDFADDEAIKKHLQMSKVAQKRMKSEAQLRKEIEEFIQFGRQNPRGLLKELGLNDRELAEQIINEAIDEAKKSPDQIEKEKLQAELQEYKRKAEEDKKKHEDAEFNALVKEESARLDSEISEALESGGVPKSPYTVKKMAEYMRIALKNDVALSPKDVIALVKKEMQEDLKQFFSASPDDLVEELVSSERIANIRKKNLAKLRDSTKNVETLSSIKSVGTTSKETAPKEPAKKMLVKDWLRS